MLMSNYGNLPISFQIIRAKYLTTCTKRPVPALQCILNRLFVWQNTALQKVTTPFNNNDRGCLPNPKLLSLRARNLAVYLSHSFGNRGGCPGAENTDKRRDTPRMSISDGLTGLVRLQKIWGSVGCHSFWVVYHMLQGNRYLFTDTIGSHCQLGNIGGKIECENKTEDGWWSNRSRKEYRKTQSLLGVC